MIGELPLFTSGNWVVFELKRNPPRPNSNGYKLKKTIAILDSLLDVLSLPAGTAIPGDKADPSHLHFVVAVERGRLLTYSFETLRCVHEHVMPHAPAKHADPVAAAAVGKLLYRKALEDETEEGEGAVPRPSSETQLIAATLEQNILFYNAESMSREKLVVGFNDEIIDCVTLPDNKRAVVATNSAQVRMFDLDTLDSDLLVGHTDIVLSLDVSACGRFLVTGSKDKTVRFWHLGPTGESVCVAVCSGHAESVGAVTFSRGLNGTLYAVSGSRDRTLKMWDASPLLKLGDTPDPSAPLHILNTTANAIGHEKDVNTLAVAPHDKLIASGSQDRTVCLWDQSLTKVGTLKGHKRGVWSVEFSPVDKVLASCSGDKTIKIWSISDFTCLKTFEGHTNSVLRVQFLNAGMQLVSAGSDSVVKLWTIKTNECTSTFEGHEAKIWAMCLTKDQKRLVTGGADSLLHVWRDVSEEQADEAAADAEARVQKEQKLSNAMRGNQWEEAALLAIDLAQPR